MIGIYKLTSPSGKIYIGKSKNLNKRLNAYKNMLCESQPKIYNALVKYGWDNFTVEILFSSDKEYKYVDLMLNALEVKYIKHFDSYKNGYNSTKGGDGVSGKITSEETKQKLSIKAKAQWERMTDEEYNEFRLKMSIAQIGKKHSEETIEKCRQSKLGELNPMYGKTPSQETINKGIETKMKSGLIKKVYQYDLKGNLIREWNSANEATKELNLSSGGISRVLNGKRKHCGGYLWKWS